MTYWFSSIFRPFSRSTQACVSKSILSTQMVRVVRTRLLLDDPVAVSFCTFRIVVDRTQSSSLIKLYACHISSGSSGTRTTELYSFKSNRLVYSPNVMFHYVYMNENTHPDMPLSRLFWINFILLLLMKSLSLSQFQHTHNFSHLSLILAIAKQFSRNITLKLHQFFSRIDCIHSQISIIYCVQSTNVLSRLFFFLFLVHRWFYFVWLCWRSPTLHKRKRRNFTELEW